MYVPDDFSSDEEGFSDLDDYHDFKKRMKNSQNENRQATVESEAEKTKKRLQSIYSIIAYGRYDTLVKELDEGKGCSTVQQKNVIKLAGFRFPSLFSTTPSLDANIRLENEWTPLLLAASIANKKIISELLKRGANINQTRETFTPLMYLCNSSTNDAKEDILDCVKLLIDSGADVNVIDNKRRNAFMLAAYNGHLKAVEFLLPIISDKEAEDNQRWTALFWAVSGNQLEVVDLLLKEGFACDKTDIRSNTVVDIAQSSGFEDILNILPQDPSEECYLHHLTNNNFSFEEIFANRKKGEKPLLLNDVCKILYGTRSESAIPLFLDNNIGLLEFLSLNDSKLKDIGIQLPYQRNRILGGLYKFHKHPFQPKSIPFVGKNDIYTNIDVSSAVFSCIKQLIAMEASLKFIMNNYEDKLNREDSNEIEIALRKVHGQLDRLQINARQLVKRTEMWDSTLKPVDRIKIKRWNIPWSHLFLSVSVLSLVTVFLKLK